MKRVLILASVLLLGAAVAVSQDQNTPSSNPSSDQAAPQTQQAPDQSQSPQAAPNTQQNPNSNPNNPNSPSTPSDQSGANAQGSSSASGQTTVQGCLSGSNGNYTLTQDTTGTTYTLTGDTSQLQQHIGHEVQITGTTGNSSSTGTSGSAAPSSGSQSG